jgi:ATP/maltotriose-dependent transcriptional regulator MalT
LAILRFCNFFHKGDTSYSLCLLETSYHLEPVQHTGTAKPLSDRESDELNLLASSLSNKEIANRSSIELRMFKWHTGDIFGKLGVKNCTQAVARERYMNIL